MASADVATSRPAPAPTAPPSEAREEFDLFRPMRSAGSLENPYPIYKLLRTVRPVMQVPVPDWDGPGAWLMTRHRDVHFVLTDPRFSVDRAAAPLIRDNMDRLPQFIRQSTQGLRSMLVMDPPDHTRVRKLVNKAFTPRRVAALGPRIDEIIDQRLDRMAAAGRTDLIHDLAEPLPAIVIAELLGVPASDHRQFREWSSTLIAGVGNTGDRTRLEAAQAAGQKIFEYLGDVIQQRRQKPEDDLISAMIHAQEENEVLTDLELLATANLILLAGHETTTNLIGNGMLALLRNPDQLERLRGDMDLMPKAVEELLRYDGPVQATIRVPTEDVEIDGHAIPKGSMVLVNIGAANHDPDVFEEPDVLDIGREPNPHLGFGFGVHFCMGAPMARLETRKALEKLLTRFPKITLETEAPEYRSNPVLRGIKRLELSLG